jgi:hypothetical protein
LNKGKPRKKLDEL